VLDLAIYREFGAPDDPGVVFPRGGRFLGASPRRRAGLADLHACRPWSDQAGRRRTQSG